MLHAAVEEVVDTLVPRERRVLQLRFGLIDGRERTLEEVGKRFGSPASGFVRSRPRPCASSATLRAKKLRDYFE